MVLWEKHPGKTKQNNKQTNKLKCGKMTVEWQTVADSEIQAQAPSGRKGS